MIPEARGVTITFHINVSPNIIRKESNHDKSLCASQRHEDKYQNLTRHPQKNVLFRMQFNCSFIGICYPIQIQTVDLEDTQIV